MNRRTIAGLIGALVATLGLAGMSPFTTSSLRRS